jgi:KDO2-lipid IV(A) lauroyltransferase
VAVPPLKRLRRSFRSHALVAAVRLLRLLPARLVMALGAGAGWLAWHLSPSNRRQMLEHLAVAFPGWPEARRAATARACLRHLGWLAAEVVSVSHYDDRLEEYVTFAPGAEARLRAAHAQGRGILWITGHVGNWELMARRVARTGIPCATIAKAGQDPRITALLEDARTGGNVEVLWRESPSTARAMIRCFRQGKLLGILIDQDTRVQGVFVPFFGRPAFTPRAAGDLALRFHAPVLVGWCRRRGPRPGAGHEVCVEEIPYESRPADAEAESVRITARATAILQQAIEDRPEEWVWMHERWKTPPPEATEGASPPHRASSMPKTRELSDG